MTKLFMPFKKLGKVMGILLVAYLLVLFFLPKTSFWYEAEAELLKRKVIVHNETLEEGLRGLKISQAELYLGPIQAARIASIEINSWLFYTTVAIKNLFVGSELPLLKGLHVKKATINYLLFSDIKLEAQGNFGSLEATIDLDKKSLELDLVPTAWLKRKSMIMSRLKKTPKGYRFAWHY